MLFPIDCLYNSNCDHTGYRLRDIIAYRGWIWLYTPSGGTPSNNIVFYTTLKSTFSELQFFCWQLGSIFIRLAVVVSQICEITWNTYKIRIYSSSTSFEVIGVYRWTLINNNLTDYYSQAAIQSVLSVWTRKNGRQQLLFNGLQKNDCMGFP